MAAVLKFDAEAHEYTLDGRRLPSVTEVLSIVHDFSMVPKDMLAAAAEFGQHVHIACDLHDRGELDWDRVDPSLVPYVSAWRDFLIESGAVVIASEMRVYHATLGYAGSPDKVLAWGGRYVIPDIKSTAVVPYLVGSQTAAYAKAWNSTNEGREPARYCIHLKPDGKYKAHARRDPADWSNFLSCLNTYKLREKCRASA